MTGIAEAGQSAFGESTIFQRCIVHIIRNSLKYIPSKHYKEFCTDLKSMYGAVSLESAEANFDKLSERWGNKYPGAVRIWKQNFIYVAQLFDYPIEIRKQIYTTNMIESLNSALKSYRPKRRPVERVRTLQVALSLG